ncbi:hypothetical protein [Streptomyces lonarensis]|uniref:hypothetical protein n=1 Tax=Streptomyces lonarensis TaxID=700599 RepID=UPI0030C6D17F
MADPFGLYRIAADHTPEAAAIGEAAHAGRLRLVAPAAAFAVACSMRTCWDDACGRPHRAGTGTPLRRLAESGGVEVRELTPAEAVSAGQLYAAHLDRRVTGAEVLAACHATLLAATLPAGLVSTVRAAYYYAAVDRDGARPAMALV